MNARAHIGSAALICLCATASGAQDRDILIAVQRLNKIENPAQVEKTWSDIAETSEGRDLIDQATKGVGAQHAIATTARIHYLKNRGNQHWGVISAPDDYTACMASVERPVINCKEGSFVGALKAHQPGKLDGFHWYMIVPRRQIGAPSCWIDGTVVITFVATDKKAQYPCQAVNGPPVFQYGRKALARDLP